MSYSPALIGIAGPSGAGKSALAACLARMMGRLDPLVFPLDAYYRDLSVLPMADRERQNVDHPAALEWPLIERHLAELARGGRVERPIYDFAAHARTSEREPAGPTGLIIVEGLFALHPRRIRERYRTSVFIEIDEQLAFERRLRRDTGERGSAPDYVARQWRETVRPMCRVHVRPTRRYADLVLRGDQPLELSARTVFEHFEGRG